MIWTDSPLVNKFLVFFFRRKKANCYLSFSRLFPLVLPNRNVYKRIVEENAEGERQNAEDQKGKARMRLRPQLPFGMIEP